MRRHGKSSDRRGSFPTAGCHPPKFRVIATSRPKYAFQVHDGVIQALARRISSKGIADGGR
jgi:hypothetical protein